MSASEYFRAVQGDKGAYRKIIKRKAMNEKDTLELNDVYKLKAIMDQKQLQEVVEEIIMKGFLKGFKEGMQESKLEIAKSMVKKNFHISSVEEMTGISAEYIEDLRQEL